jgi:hypothetical protein
MPSDVMVLSSPCAADCPDCGLPLARLSIDDILKGGEEGWTRRFLDAESMLPAGRYRCEGCLSEWWQFPAMAAS